MKKLIIGIIIGFTLAISTNAFAAVGDSVTAVFAQFSYKVNGTAQPLTSPVLTYEGGSYLRTTDIGNMLGFDVTYKADARTIEFSGGPEPSATLTPTPAPSNEPTPASTGTSDPLPTTEATPTTTTEPTATPTPTPAPDNTASCQAIRDNYGGQIAMVGYGGSSTGQQRLKVLQLEYARDQALSSAGCN